MLRNLSKWLGVTQLSSANHLFLGFPDMLSPFVFGSGSYLFLFGHTVMVSTSYYILSWFHGFNYGFYFLVLKNHTVCWHG